MNNQKGQIQIIIVILLVIIGVVFFANLPKLTEQIRSPGSTLPSQPASQQESVISPSEEEEETPSSPSPVADNYSPYRFNGQPSGNLPAATRKTFISLETNEKAICRYSTVFGMSYYSMNRIFSNTDSTFHSTQVTGLSEGQGYAYYIKCVDEYDNTNTDDFMIYFYVKNPDDFTAPVRRNQYPTGDVLAAGTTQTIIGISTNEPAYCRYSFSQGTSYKSMKNKLSDDGTKKYHTAQVSGLVSGQIYNFFVRCKDLEDNVNTGDVMIYFSVE